MHNLGLVVIYIASTIFMIPYIGLLVVKLLHLITGWKPFSFICMIVDLVLTLFFASAMINAIIGGIINVSLVFFAIILVLPPAIAFMSEAASLGK